jgi:hypothetical protein
LISVVLNLPSSKKDLAKDSTTVATPIVPAIKAAVIASMPNNDPAPITDKPVAANTATIRINTFFRLFILLPIFVDV